MSLLETEQIEKYEKKERRERRAESERKGPGEKRCQVPTEGKRGKKPSLLYLVVTERSVGHIAGVGENTLLSNRVVPFISIAAFSPTRKDVEGDDDA